ncbi:hemolytic protein HlpA [soil metagenome]
MSTFIPNVPLHTPVLLVVFNRPDSTRKVLETIRIARPSRLYVAADGPRPHISADIENCKEVRKVIDEIDWPCEVKTRFLDENLNCGKGPSSAFTWFFEHEEAGIILEDDCIPAQSFFWFCQELLERYRDDYRIMHIGGNNFLNGWQKDNDYSYYFSNSGHIWGWATWRRAWQMYDFKIELYSKLKSKNYFDNFFLNSVEKFYRLRKFDRTVANEGHVDWWDYQWDFARYVQSGLAVVPKINLVKNIGFDGRATHTHNSTSKSAKMETTEMDFPLRHPPFVIRDIDSDRKYFKMFIEDILISKLKLS